MAGVLFPAGARDFSVLHSVQTGSEAHPASYTMSTGASFPVWVKWLGHEAGHSPSPSAKVKNGGAIFQLPTHIYMAWCLVKHRDYFNYIYTYTYTHSIMFS
jgi:hypothetical protein